jgi:lipopolysaccharide transport system ATP-binding protein
MPDTIIRVEDLSKKYIIGHQKQERYTVLRDAIANGAKSIGRKLLNPLRKNDSAPVHEDFWALKDVSFEIKRGERVGIIGRNGAGKSTLLKILSRITEPTKGRISINGRVASLLEVGTGFHPELTGRENIYLNGAILGMSKAEIKRKFDEIVAFAEVEKFLDTPVKRYSSGMYVRLAFAVAAHLEPEILVVDEVLAVGDAQFQKKCLGKMKEVGGEGRTVLFVSHNMPAIRTLCSSAIVLNKGQVICWGNINQCLATYEMQNFQNQGAMWIRSLDKPEASLAVTQINSTLHGKQPNLVLELDITLESRAKYKPAFLAVDILDTSGISIMQALPRLEGFLEDTKPQHLVKLAIDLPPLIPGQYLATVWVGSHYTETLDQVTEAIRFDVEASPTVGRTFAHHADHGYIVPRSKIQSIE